MSTETAVQRLEREKQEQLIANKAAVENGLVQVHQTYLRQYGEKDAEKVFEREKQFAMMAISKNPKIMECNSESILFSVAAVALTGLSLNPVLGFTHLVPRNGVCTLVVDYKGMTEVLYRGGRIKLMDCGVVWRSEESNLDFQEGINGYVKKKRLLTRPDGDVIVMAYSIAVFDDGTTHCHVLDKQQLDARAKVASTDAVYKAWPVEMAQKAAIRSHYKYLPKTEETNNLMEVVDKELQYTYDVNAREDIKELPASIQTENQ
jgi:phage RecT family recombinase